MKRISCVLAIIVLTLTASYPCHSDCKYWAMEYGGSGNYYAATCVQDTVFGKYIVTGCSISSGCADYDIWALMLNPDGSVVWQKRYGRPTDDIAFCIQPTSDYGFVLAGYTVTVDPLGYIPPEKNGLVIKLDTLGNTQWQKSYGTISGNEEFRSIQQTSDGGYVVAGWTDSFGPSSVNWWVLKLDADGNIVWQKAYAVTDMNYVVSIGQTPDGEYIVAGVYSYPVEIYDCQDCGPLVAIYKSYSSIFKLDADGDIVWTSSPKRFDTDIHEFCESTQGATERNFTEYNQVCSAQVTSDGGVVMVGYCFVSYHPSQVYDDESRIYVRKLNGNGIEEWWTEIEGYCDIRSVCETPDGGYIVAGGRSASPSYVYAMRLSTSGDVMWQRSYVNGSALHICKTSEDDYVLAGLSSGNLLALKIDTNGGGLDTSCVNNITAPAYSLSVPNVFHTISVVDSTASPTNCMLATGDTYMSPSIVCGSPEIAVEPPYWDYGQVTIGEYEDKTFTVSNPGCWTLRVADSQIIGSGDFSVQGDSSFDLDPGESHDVVVRFEPSSSGSKFEMLELAANIVGKEQFVVGLGGIGVHPSSISVVSPNGGEEWCGGSTHPITWLSEGTDIARIYLQYSADSGGSYHDIDNVDASESMYQWKLPLIESSTVRVKVIAKDSGGTILAEDESDGDFAIQLPEIAVTPEILVFGCAHGGDDPAAKTLNITNPGCGTLDWTIEINSGGGSVSNGVPWLSCIPMSGDTTSEIDEVEVAVTTAGLAEGTHNATISISAPAASNSPQVVPVTLYIGFAQTFEHEMAVSGWHLISLPLDPVDPRPGAVLASINQIYNSIWAYDPDTGWSIYDPEGASDLTELVSGKGYWLMLEQPGTLSFLGTTPSQTAVTLKGDKWNLVGFSRLEERDAAECMRSVEDYIDSVWKFVPDEDWSIYVPGGSSDLEVMGPGFGFWIKANETCSWDVNAGTQ